MKLQCDAHAWDRMLPKMGCDPFVWHSWGCAGLLEKGGEQDAGKEKEHEEGVPGKSIEEVLLEKGSAACPNRANVEQHAKKFLRFRRRQLERRQHSSEPSPVPPRTPRTWGHPGDSQAHLDRWPSLLASLKHAEMIGEVTMTG